MGILYCPVCGSMKTSMCKEDLLFQTSDRHRKLKIGKCECENCRTTYSVTVTDEEKALELYSFFIGRLFKPF